MFANWYIRWLCKSDDNDVGDETEAEKQVCVSNGQDCSMLLRWQSSSGVRSYHVSGLIINILVMSMCPFLRATLCIIPSTTLTTTFDISTIATI
jgi:hypothetical protein